MATALVHQLLPFGIYSLKLRRLLLLPNKDKTRILLLPTLHSLLWNDPALLQPLRPLHLHLRVIIMLLVATLRRDRSIPMIHNRRALRGAARRIIVVTGGVNLVRVVATLTKVEGLKVVDIQVDAAVVVETKVARSNPRHHMCLRTFNPRRLPTRGMPTCRT